MSHDSTNPRDNVIGVITYALGLGLMVVVCKGFHEIKSVWDLKSPIELAFTALVVFIIFEIVTHAIDKAIMSRGGKAVALTAIIIVGFILAMWWRTIFTSISTLSLPAGGMFDPWFTRLWHSPATWIFTAMFAIPRSWLRGLIVAATILFLWPHIGDPSPGWNDNVPVIVGNDFDHWPSDCRTARHLDCHDATQVELWNKAAAAHNWLFPPDYRIGL